MEWDGLNKKIFAVLVAVGLTISLGTDTMAVTIGELKSQKSKALEAKQKYLDSYKGKEDKINKLESSIEKMDEQIEGLMNEVEKNKKDIKKYESNISQVENSIEEEQTKVDEQQKLLDERLSATYKSGSTGYLSVILSSKSFSDLLTRVEAVSKIASFDKNLIKDHEEAKAELQDKKNELSKAETALVKVKEANEVKVADLEDTKAKEGKLVSKAKKEAKGFDEKINHYATLLISIDKQIREKEEAAQKAKESANRAATRTTYSRGSISLPTDPSGSNGSNDSGNASYSGDAIVSYATKFIGLPYRWGGTSPSTGFDCSGFTQYVYAHFGIQIPRTSGAQSVFGTPVAQSDLQPGDLVFFGSPVHHVGMYVGNGCYIHSPQTGESIKISPLNRSDYSGARRVR